MGIRVGSDVDPTAIDLRENPCIDFGRLDVRIPSVVFTPTTIDGLQATLVWLRDRRVPYKVRGAAHSSGGQTLTTSAVVELRGISRIVHDDGETITVEGGATWQQVVDALGPSGRRPPVLTDNLRTTVAGTLSVGGFGDGTHRYGIQAQTVVGLTLVTPDGARDSLAPDDERFRYALSGLGQLGVIAEVTLRTVRRSRMLAGRGFHFADLAAFARDMAQIIDGGYWDIARARLVWRDREPPFVEAMGGDLRDDDPPIGAMDPALLAIAPAVISPPRRIDLMAAVTATQGDIDTVTQPTPALELTLPLPDGVEAWEHLRTRIEAIGLHRWMRGAAVAIVPRAPELPWAPISPAAPTSLLVALRPCCPLDVARASVPELCALADDVIARGGRIYGMSVGAIDPARLERQFGAAYARMRELKQRVDPDGICNPGAFR